MSIHDIKKTRRHRICLYEQFGIECSCGKRPETYEEKLNKQIAAVPLEIKQKILDLAHKGKTIGEIKEAVQLETMVVSGIIVENIKSIAFLNQKAVS